VKIFFSGATGVIGRRAVPQLLALGHDITAMARSPAKADAISKVGASPAIADLFDKPGLREAVAGHDAVINLAAPMTSFSSLAAFLPGAWAENDRTESLDPPTWWRRRLQEGYRFYPGELRAGLSERRGPLHVR
jgi:2-alkyl-3-oxoalkanoate reductase